MHPIRVVADLTQLVAGGENGGAARFVLDLLGALALRDTLELKLVVRPSAAHFVVPLARLGAGIFLAGDAGEVTEPRFLRRFARRLPRPLAMLAPDRRSVRRLGADVLFSPLQSAAFHETGLPHVAIAYDLQELTYPGHFNTAELRRRAAFRADLARCDRVVAISRATHEDLVARAGLNDSRISVIHPAGPTERKALHIKALNTLLALLGLEPGRFALYPANFWPHKNHETLLRALAGSRLARDPSFRLVLCGALDGGRERIRELISSLGLESRLSLFPHQPDDTMTALLQGARFLVFPSLFEGFGIPVIEAFRLGVPVACSDIAALRETAGHGALFLEPLSEDSIRHALAALWDDPALASRLSLAGRYEAARYAPDDVAALYEDAIVSAARHLR